MDIYHLIKLALAFGGVGFSLGAFAVHYHRTQKRVKQNTRRIDALEESISDSDTAEDVGSEDSQTS